MAESELVTDRGIHWEHNSVVGQAYVRIFFATILSVYSYLGHTYGWLGNPPISLFHISISFLGLMTIFLLVAGFSRSMHWSFIMTSLLSDVGFATYAMLEGGISTFFMYGIYLWIIIGYGLRFGRKYMLIANILTIIAFITVITQADFWKEHAFIGWGLMLWIVLMPLYIGKLLSKLEIAVKEADKANKAKSQFLANMSHEIRTPLTAVIGFSETALDADQTTEQRLFALNTINRSSRHLLNLINNILDFSKIDAGELEVEHVKMNPVQMLAEVESIMMIQAEKKALEFKINYNLPLPSMIKSDPIRLKQILINLCSNAIKFTEHGSVTVIADYEPTTDLVNITVCDTGIGMTYAQSQRIFQPFKQADSSTTRKFGGTGLGLSLSKQLAELLGCHLTVRSETDKGTCFKLQIPSGIADKNEMISDIAEIPANNKTETKSENDNSEAVNHGATNQAKQASQDMPLLKGSVLLAEDTEINQLLIAKYLNKMGVEVTVANNGEEAVKLALKNDFDLIYMDMQMPIMSGTDATIELRKQSYQKPIVALTANATENDRKNCIKAGCNDFLTKPIVRKTLYDTTAEYLPKQEDSIQQLSNDI
ncbi:MAG: ATP-binding protein [Thioalkalispiraceae bacterium]